MEHVSLSIINLRSNKEIAISANQVFLNIKPEYQREYEVWDDKLKTRFIESLLLQRATNPIWTVPNVEDESEEILDGMHRITTALLFFNNKFCLNKQYLLTLNENYDKKYFDNLSLDDKNKVRNYNFTFNKLDSSYSYKTNPDKLKDMYELLNRSSITLNDFEYNKVLLGKFYEIISSYKDKFNLLIDIFNFKDKRGKMDSEIIEMLTLTYELPNTWTSVKSLCINWIYNNMGKNSESVNKYIEQNKNEIIDKLNMLYKILEDFNFYELFSKNKKERNTYYLLYKFILSRCCYNIKNYSLFNRNVKELTILFKNKILVENISEQLQCTTRNSVFQQKLIRQIDDIINTHLNETGTVRNFTKKQILQKLTEQQEICTYCNKKINKNDKFEGDHIVPWSMGGKTEMSNLQILHEKCHQNKSTGN